MSDTLLYPNYREGDRIKYTREDYQDFLKCVFVFRSFSYNELEGFFSENLHLEPQSSLQFDKTSTQA